MVAPGTMLDVETKEFQLSASSYADGGFNGAAIFYQADLDKVQRKLSGVHVQMYVRFPCSVLTFYRSLPIRFAVRGCMSPPRDSRYLQNRVPDCWCYRNRSFLGFRPTPRDDRASGCSLGLLTCGKRGLRVCRPHHLRLRSNGQSPRSVVQ